MVGATLAHYEVGERLGEGGSGVVYRGRDVRLDRPVAIKVLADALRDDELAWARLLREARLAAQLIHPHIAAIYDLGEEDGRAYIVMEHVEGLPLGDIIPEGGLPREQAERYARQIAAALAFANARGVIHGDLKGSNILVTADGNIKLLDFGLGRRIPREGMGEVTSTCLPLAEAGATAGTLPYLAPEVLRGNPTTLQSDVWALGVLLYQMATGELPFRGTTPFELSMEIMVGTPPKLAQVPEPLQSAVRRCLEKETAARLPQAGEVAPLLEASAGTVELAASPRAATATFPAAEKAVVSGRSRPRWWWAALAAAVCVALLAGVYAQRVWVQGRATPAASVAPIAPTAKTAGGEDPAIKVWVNTDSGTYHCPGTRWYGRTHQGEYMTQREAKAKGYHHAGRHPCM
jgi:serine/threonine-protein kinase